MHNKSIIKNNIGIRVFIHFSKPCKIPLATIKTVIEINKVNYYNSRALLKSDLRSSKFSIPIESLINDSVIPISNLVSIGTAA